MSVSAAPSNGPGIGLSPKSRTPGWHDIGLEVGRANPDHRFRGPKRNICIAMSQPQAQCAPTRDCEVAIIGAGPYGLSLAAHLAASKVSFRVFGRPMELWRHH